MALILTPPLYVSGRALTYLTFDRVIYQTRHSLAVNMHLYEDMESKKVQQYAPVMGVVFQWDNHNGGVPDFPFNDDEPLKKQLYQNIKLYGAAVEDIVRGREDDPARLERALQQVHKIYKNVTLSTMEDDDEETTNNTSNAGTNGGAGR